MLNDMTCTVPWSIYVVKITVKLKVGYDLVAKHFTVYLNFMKIFPNIVFRPFTHQMTISCNIKYQILVNNTEQIVTW